MNMQEPCGLVKVLFILMTAVSKIHSLKLATPKLEKIKLCFNYIFKLKTL